MIITKWL